MADFLDQQFARLSALERQVMYWLAVHKGWVSLEQLQKDLQDSIEVQQFLEYLNGLQWRSMVESRVGHIALGPLVLEYVSYKLIQQLNKETGCPERLNQSATIKSDAREDIREIPVK